MQKKVTNLDLKERAQSAFTTSYYRAFQSLTTVVLNECPATSVL